MASDVQLRALEAVRCVADEYGLPTGTLKPCIAFLLDGNIGGAGRHDAAFVIAIECRRLELSQQQTKAVISTWAKKIGYTQRQAFRAIRNAYAKTPDGHWRYHPPGLHKKPGGRYAEVLGSICADVGCPANCAPFKNIHQGPKAEGHERFEHLGWPTVLRKLRHAAAADYYKAICELEKQRGFVPGAPLLTSYRQLGELAGRNSRHVGENLEILHRLGLLASFERGSGSGPHARDRKPSRIFRQVPIPAPPGTYRDAITTEAVTAPKIGAEGAPYIGAGESNSVLERGVEPLAPGLVEREQTPGEIERATQQVRNFAKSPASREKAQ